MSEFNKPEESSTTIEDANPEVLAKLVETFPPSSGPVIAVDLDDVLSATNRTVAQWHNEKYGTNMDVSHFYYYYYWKNPFWGTVAETMAKVKAFYAGNYISSTLPVPGAREGVQALRNMGYRLVVVTARSRSMQADSWSWLSEHFPGMFDSIICTGQFEEAMAKKGHEVITKSSKAEVCLDLGAKLLIDDSLENALTCATFSSLSSNDTGTTVMSLTPIPVLLFGAYQWNRRMSSAEDQNDNMTFDLRVQREGSDAFLQADEQKVIIPETAPLWRVHDWSEAIRWVESAGAQGLL